MMWAQNCVLMYSGGFRGGHSRPVPPPFETFFYKCPPFLYMCPPFWNLQKKKVADSARLYPGCYLPPPPPRRRWRSEKKSVGVPPPPPPPAYQLFWDLREFRGWRRSEKKQYVMPPLSQIPGSAPAHVQKNAWFMSVFKIVCSYLYKRCMTCLCLKLYIRVVLFRLFPKTVNLHVPPKPVGFG